jgi:hypothetical protein
MNTVMATAPLGAGPNRNITDQQLSFSSVVPKHLVHRRALSEVVLTDWAAVGTDSFLCAAQWSRSHSLYRVRHGLHDALLMAETLRQSGILLSHTELDVPLDHRFLIDRIAWLAHPYGLACVGAPVDVVGQVDVTRQGSQRGAVRRMQFDVVFTRDGKRIGTGTAWARSVGPRIYERLRAGRIAPPEGPLETPQPLNPAVVGVHDPDDVVLGAPVDGQGWPLRVLTTHPVLFDHPVDHVPGMLVMEGMRQAGRALLGWRDAQPFECDVTFERFVEFDSPCFVRARVLRQSAADTATLAVEAVQDGHVAALGTVEMTNTAPAR